MIKDTESPLKIGTWGAGKCTIENLTPEEIELIRGAILGGHNWVRRGTDGRLEKVPSYVALPSPVEDAEMHPFWRHVNPTEAIRLVEQVSLPGVERLSGQSPSISIQHLCGYYYTPESYKANGQRLESYGFQCLRSRRGGDGQFWEIWFLPGIWSAKGALKEAIEHRSANTDGIKLDRALEFLRVNVQFGTLDLCVQRLVQRMPD